MSPLRVRREPAPDDGLFLVRGDELVAETLRRDAIRTYRRFGEYGVSVLGASTDADIDELAAGLLRRFEVLTVMKPVHCGSRASSCAPRSAGRTTR